LSASENGTSASTARLLLRTVVEVVLLGSPLRLLRLSVALAARVINRDSPAAHDLAAIIRRRRNRYATHCDLVVLVVSCGGT